MKTTRLAKGLFLLTCLLYTATATAITAKQVLDKTAANVSNKGGVTATFSMSNANLSQMGGTLKLKGNKFFASTTHVTVWFNGKTQWTYMKNNDEVNVSNPNASQLQMLNPYTFINLYKKGYDCTMTQSEGNYVVHLKAQAATSNIKEAYVTIDKTFRPKQVRMLQGKGWTTINITDFQKSKLDDDIFNFNSKDYPKAEIIDLR